ncbi:MAG TPA: cytochrome c biogenesis protein CcsA [Candidatus Acidoferrales bacterium]|nr:cytochrome c biogenesis protein CcsA [Candidatus Acidoferrales bacterium]
MNLSMDFAALGLYVASFVAYAVNLYHERRWLGRVATVLLILALVAHYYALLERSRMIHGIPYDDLYGSMSLFAWLVGVTYLGLETYHRHRAVGSLVVPFVVFWLIVAMSVAPAVVLRAPRAKGALFALHITIGILAYAAFAISFLLSIIYLVQNRVLRHGKPGLAFWRFPALDVLERMSLSSVWVGLVALLVGTGLGFAWEHGLTGQFAIADPKVLVTLIVLAVYAAYLVIVRTPAWRGARAALVCVFNFAIVLFSYTIVNLYFTDFHRFF